MTDHKPTVDPKTTPGEERLAPPKLSFAKQLTIWGLILVVGVLFGIGQSFYVLMAPVQKVGEVDANQITQRQSVRRKLLEIQGLLQSPYAARYLNEQVLAQQVVMSRRAAAEGLLPKGADLDRLVEEFLDQPLPTDPRRTNRAAIAEHTGGPLELTKADLRLYLSEENAVRAWYLRRAPVPAVPRTVAGLVSAAQSDQVAVDEVVLDAASLLAPVADDDAEIGTLYDRIKSERFVQPAQVSLTVAHVDVAALAELQTVSDDEVAARYTKDREELYKKLAIDPAAPPEYRAVTEVADLVRASVRRDKALDQARAKILAFDATAGELVDQPDNRGFIASASAAGMAVRFGLVVFEDQGKLDLQELGTKDDLIGLFADAQPGFVSGPLLTNGPGSTWLLLRLDAKAPPGTKNLDEVKGEVKQLLAGQRVYAPFMTAVEAARVAAQAQGLPAWAASASTAGTWPAVVTGTNLSPVQELRAPAAQLGGLPGEARLAASLATSDRPVVVAEVGDGTGAQLPKVKLVQARDYRAAPPVDPEAARMDARRYRGALNEFRSEIVQREAK